MKEQNCSFKTRNLLVSAWQSMSPCNFNCDTSFFEMRTTLIKILLTYISVSWHSSLYILSSTRVPQTSTSCCSKADNTRTTPTSVLTPQTRSHCVLWRTFRYFLGKVKLHNATTQRECHRPRDHRPTPHSVIRSLPDPFLYSPPYFYPTILRQSCCC